MQQIAGFCYLIQVFLWKKPRFVSLRRSISNAMGKEKRCYNESTSWLSMITETPYSHPRVSFQRVAVSTEEDCVQIDVDQKDAAAMLCFVMMTRG